METITTNDEQAEWSGSCDPCDPSNYWIDDETGERVSAETGERSEHVCPEMGTLNELPAIDGTSR